jgi:hypothetical protein
MSCHVMSCHVILCHVIILYVMPCHAMLCYAISSTIISCHTILRYTVLYCTVIYCTVRTCAILNIRFGYCTLPYLIISTISTTHRLLLSRHFLSPNHYPPQPLPSFTYLSNHSTQYRTSSPPTPLHPLWLVHMCLILDAYLIEFYSIKLSLRVAGRTGRILVRSVPIVEIL